MTQQTLEEVAKEIFKGEYVSNRIDIVPIWREGFIYGAKWQQEQEKNNYNEQDMKIAFDANIKDWISFEEFIEQFKKK